MGEHRRKPAKYDSDDEHSEDDEEVDRWVDGHVGKHVHPTHIHPREEYNYSLTFRCSSLSTLDSGSGREVPAIWHGTGKWYDVIYPRILTDSRISFLAQCPTRGTGRGRSVGAPSQNTQYYEGFVYVHTRGCHCVLDLDSLTARSTQDDGDESVSARGAQPEACRLHTVP